MELMELLSTLREFARRDPVLASLIVAGAVVGLVTGGALLIGLPLAAGVVLSGPVAGMAAYAAMTWSRGGHVTYEGLVRAGLWGTVIALVGAVGGAAIGAITLTEAPVVAWATMGGALAGGVDVGVSTVDSEVNSLSYGPVPVNRPAEMTLAEPAVVAEPREPSSSKGVVGALSRN